MFLLNWLELGATRIQLDEAALVKDLTAEEKSPLLEPLQQAFG